MNITVVGYKGIVGNATFKLFQELGHTMHGIDLDSTTGTRKSDNIIFICVPERFVTLKLIEEYATSKTPFIVIRSTVYPETCNKLQEQTGIHIIHNPEFLREASAINDSFNPDRIIFGECCKEHGDILEELYKPLCRPIYRAKEAKTTELAKIACNGYLATVISYWNCINKIAYENSINGTEIGMLASTDSRISDYGSRFHNKYNGKCLPKEMQQLIKLSNNSNLRFENEFLNSIVNINNNTKEL